MSLNSLSIVTKMIAGFISVKVLSVLLGPSALALLGNFKNVKNAVKSFSTLGVQKGVIKYVAEYKTNEKERSTVLSTAFFMILCSSVFLGITSILFSHNIGLYLFKTTDYKMCVIAFGALLPLYGFQVFSVSIINGLREFKALVVLSMMSSVFALLLTVGFIWYYKTFGALLALAVVESLVVVFYVFFFVRKKIVFNQLKWSLISRKYVVKLSSYSVMTFTTALIVPFSMLYIRNLIIKYYGLNEAGLWEALNRISGYYLMIIISGISIYYLPKLSGIATDKEFEKEIKDYFKSFVPLCLLLFVVVFLFREFIISMALSSAFYKINDLLMYQLVGDFFKISSYAFSQQFLAKRLTSRYVITEVVFYIVYLLGAILLIPDYGIEGVVFSYLISYVVYFLMMVFYFRKTVYQLTFAKFFNN